MITHKLQNIDFCSDISKLLCEIDVKLGDMAESKLNSERYGTSCKIDINRFFILSNYKKLLLDKANNTKCLCGYSVDDFINIIKQYLTSGKVLKFKPSTTLEETTGVEEKPKVNMYVIHNHYGDNITYNHSSNRYITEVSGDYWDQTDW